MHPCRLSLLSMALAVICVVPSPAIFAAPPYVTSASGDSPLILAASTPTEPGQLAVDEEAAERALERALVSTGVLLLPPGRAEIEPALTYLRGERGAPIMVSLAGQQFSGEQRANTDIFEAGVLLRFGLPARAQLEFDVPYRYVNEERVTEVGFQPAAATNAHDSGIGDLRIGIAKALLAEGAGRPNLVARVIWDTNTGKVGSNEVALGATGYNEVAFSISATKRQDPLVFVSELFYQKALDERDHLEPGDQFGVSLGTLLAASPHTSLRFALDQAYVRTARLNGVTISGSDALVSSLVVGASSIVGNGKFLDFSVQAGLTDAAPAYGFRLALTNRFDARRPF